MSTEIGLRALVAKWRAFADENDVYALDADSIGIASECVAAERKAKSLRTCADELESILAAPQAAPAGMVLVPRETLKWWRELVDLNPADLAPRIDRMLAAAPAAQLASASKIVAWTEKDGDEWIVYDAESETGQHIAAFQKDRHFKEIFPIYDAAPAVVVDEAMVERACREYVGYDGDGRNSVRAALAAALNQGKANG